MSDNFIVLLPEDPQYVPDETRHVLARDRFREIAPEADEITITLHDTVEFFWCGDNFERILCPSCHRDVSNDWWFDRMDEDYDSGFKLLRYPVPCCGSPHALHELVYQ